MTNLLNTKRAAKILKVDQSRIRQLCIEGKIEADKIGRDWIIKPEAIEDYIKSNKKLKKIFDVQKKKAMSLEDYCELYSKTF